MKQLTMKEATALLRVKDGGDIYDPRIAGPLRSVERKQPAFISIGEPQMYRGTGIDVVPYFGAIATPAGVRAARARLKEVR